nr:hypothetical protein [Tanacetum cinerariifolium]
QNRANIIKTSTFPHDSPPRVTSLAADEGSMQQKLNELTDLCTRLQRHQTEMASKIAAQDLEITSLKARIKLLEDKDRGVADLSGEDATIKGRSSETREEAEVATVSIPPAGKIPTVSVPTGSCVVPTASPIFTTATVATPYSRRKDEPASLVRDVSEREACLTESGFIADQDRATIAKSSTLHHDSAPRVTSPAVDEGSMQHTIFKLMALCTSLQRQYSKLMAKFQAQEVEILSGSIPTAGPLATIISTGSEVGPTASLIVTRRKGKEVMVESDTPKKKKLQEQIDAQVKRELEEQQEKEDMKMNKQIARDAEVVRIHVEQELQGMIDSLDKSNETIANYKLQVENYSQMAEDLTRKIYNIANSP